MNSKFSGHIACFLAYAIFGVNIVTCKDLTASGIIPPIELFCFRAVGACFLFWLISFFIPKEKVEKRDFPKIFIASALGYFGTQLTFLLAISDITPMDCSIVSAISPILTMIIASIALKEPITLKKASGVALSFCGVVFLILNSVSAHAGSVETRPRGVLLIVANCLCFALYLGIFKPLIEKYSVVTFMKWIFLFALVMAIPFAAPGIMKINYSALTPKLLSELMFLVIFATFIAYFLIPIGQKRIRPTLVSMYSYMQPIIATALSIWAGMDTLTWQKVVAAATVFTGVAIVNRSKAKIHYNSIEKQL